MESITFWISGRPATFATNREKPWKKQLLNQAPKPSLEGKELGIRLRFILQTLTPGGQPLDVDNLCEPVFSVLIGQLGWFGRTRPKLHWWQATKEEGSKPGCEITIYTANMVTVPQGIPDYDEVYSGPYPKKAKSQELGRWSWNVRRKKEINWIPEHCILFLDFFDTSRNIGDIPTGVVKSTIDCLYPWLGGQEGQPDDHRITNLAVLKISNPINKSGVRIRLWAKGSIESSLKKQPTTLSENKKNDLRSSHYPKNHTPSEKITNPCVGGSRKWIVCEGALAEKIVKQVQSDLENAHPGSGKRIKEYISDLRTENKLDIIIVDGRLICSGYRG